MNTIPIATLLNMTESEVFDFKSREYKFYGATDDEKGELLKDIIAFANAWKIGDAFIVMGVSEMNGRKDAVVGVATSLQDHDVQQFVNSKMNRPVQFLVYGDKAEGKDLTVIQVAQVQRRPIFLTKPFGKVKANEVYIRSGSSTTIASPDIIAEMATADHESNIALASLDIEWAEPGRKRLGKEITVTCVRLLDPRKPSPAEAIQALIEGRKWESSLHAAPPVRRSSKDDPRDNYVRERAMLAPLGILVKNLGLRNASAVKVRITIPKREGVRVVDENGLPRDPAEFMTPNRIFSGRTSVEETDDTWLVEIDAETVQPQDEFWSYEDFYISGDIDQKVEVTAKIFADDLSQPIEIPLRINIEVKAREITLADYGLESEESE